ncbi:hypothetical protein AMTR_s00003p00166850 [Amborella trichopoda]|uniref:Uncharacterized protein n=1 Tax=Amborella trichopoda TaxID=13333 RepID=W1P6M0_AMBTC|nr:hypothetical protein AMTR_s00003p00166850 [Amborella trichopoda]
MEIERRKLKRKPLADCTNTISRASSEIKKSFAKPKVQNPKKFESKTGRKNPPKDDTKTCGENPKKNDSKFNGENPKKHDSKISGENRKKHDSRTSGENSEKYDTSTSSNDAVSKEIQRFWPANPSVRRSTEAGLNGSKSIDQDEVPWSQSDTRKNAEVLPASCPPMVPIARFWRHSNMAHPSNRKPPTCVGGTVAWLILIIVVMGELAETLRASGSGSLASPMPFLV